MAKPLVRSGRAATHPGNQTPAAKAPAKTPAPSENLPATTGNADVVPAKGLSSRFAKAAGKGTTENMSAKDYAIPFLKILDKSSGEAIESSDKYVEGARPGMLFNTVTKELFDGKEGVIVVPCGYKPVILEWESTEPGSGFIAEHLASSTIKADSQAELVEQSNGGKRLIIPSNGHCLQDANNYYILLVKEDGEIEQCIISMTGSNLTVSRLWNSAMSNRKMVIDGQRMKAPSYGIQYLMKSKATTDGQFHWHTWEFEDVGLIEDDKLFDHAESFYETVIGDRVKPAYNSVVDPAVADGNTDHEDDQEAIPFS